MSFGAAWGVLVLGVPLLIVSQWLAVRWGLPTRQIFNGWLLISAAVVLALRGGGLRSYRRELLITAAVVVAISGSVLANLVPLSVAVRGSLPYVAPIVFLLAGLAHAPDRDTLVLGARAGAGSVALMGVASIPQLALGEPGFVWLGQDLPYPRWWERGRATGLVANPGRLAQLGLIGLSLTPLLRHRAEWVVGLVALALAASGARLAAAGALGLLAMSFLMRRTEAARRIWWGALGSVILFGVIQVVLPAARSDLVERTETTLEELQADDGIPDDLRVVNMRASLRAWAAHPILGTGPGRFGSTTAWASSSELHEQFGLPDVRSQGFLDSLRASGDQREIDVGTAQLDLGWFQILSELGLAGFAAFVALLTSIAWRAIQKRRVTTLALIVALAVLTVGGPGLVDISLAGVVLWWAGSTLATPGSS